MKGIAIIAGIVFLAIIIVAVILVYTMSIPITGRLTDKAIVEKMKTTMLEMDNVIQTVYSEGNGSRREVSINLKKGKLSADSNGVYYDLETDAKIISPRTMQRIGNLIFGSNLGVSVREGVFSGVDSFIMENQHLIVYIKKIGREEAPASYKTDDLLLGVYNKDLGQNLSLYSLEISVDDNESSKSGTGYTTSKLGSNFPYGKVVAFINTSYINYKIEFVLESGADFIEIIGESL